MRKCEMNQFEFLLADDVKDNWGRCEGASPEAIAALKSNCQFELPQEYLDFLAFSNGSDTEISVDPLWCILFAAEEVLEANEDYELSADLPGFFAIGTSGGGEVIVFDTRDGPWRVCTVRIPFEEEDVWDVAPSFIELLKMFGRPDDELHVNPEPSGHR